mmetsp:Transcript_14058/g.24695  ORF Transcript_14058/g.24695 Transcript_14058/m.24695 type:complete len:497 (+) Transcript_14058:100-1590(+)
MRFLLAYLCLCANLVGVQAVMRGSVRQATDAASRQEAANMPNLTWQMLDRFIVLPEYNLLFCYIEKVACTAFNDLFSQLRRKFDPTVIRTHGNKGWFQNSPYFRWYGKRDLERILVNRSWHKAVFYRDPVERFVSAHRSKCDHFDSYDGGYLCKQAFGSETASFVDAADKMFEIRDLYGDDETVNEHFRRQGSFCGGLDNTLQYYDTVEQLTFNTAREKVLRLMGKIGASPDDVEDFDTLFPAPEEAANLQEESSEIHTSHSQDHLREYFPEDHPEFLAEVFVYYEDDYRLFNISRSRWQDEQLARTLMMAKAINDKNEEEKKKKENEGEEGELAESRKPMTMAQTTDLEERKKKIDAEVKATKIPKWVHPTIKKQLLEKKRQHALQRSEKEKKDKAVSRQDTKADGERMATRYPLLEKRLLETKFKKKQDILQSVEKKEKQEAPKTQMVAPASNEGELIEKMQDARVGVENVGAAPIQSDEEGEVDWSRWEQSLR